MDIGKKIKQLRLRKGLTQEELAERTDLTKGHISQLERELNSPSIETLFSLLEVLGTTPRDFFDDSKNEKVIYTPDEQIVYTDEDLKYHIRWLVPRSNENEMDPVQIEFEKEGQFKNFEPSASETFIFVQKGHVKINLGDETFFAKAGDAVYYQASAQHQLINVAEGKTMILLVATESHL